MQNVDEKNICITYFVNPHLFWYTIYNETKYKRIFDMEVNLSDYQRDVPQTPHEFLFKQDSMVAVNYLRWDKYIRCIVKETLPKQYTSEVSYIVWAIDHGFPFETHEKYVRRMPEVFSLMQFDYVRCGGIARVVPAEYEFDYVEQCNIIQIRDMWCKRASESLHKKISYSARVAFVKDFQNAHDQNWGDLHIFTHRGKKIKASSFLIYGKVGTEDSITFGEFCQTEINFPYWRFQPCLTNILEHSLQVPYGVIHRTTFRPGIIYLTVSSWKPEELPNSDDKS